MDRTGRTARFRQRLTVAGVVVTLAVALGYGALALAPATEAPETLGPHAQIVRPAAVVDVAARSPVEVRAFPGTVHPARSSRLAFRVGGPLIELPVREGETVAAGTLLGRIDPRDFELAVAELDARLNAAEADHRLAELNHDRRAQLVARGHASRADLDQAVAERDRTAADLASLTQQLETARAALADTRLIAPFDGRVARLQVELHDYVTARAAAVTFHDTSGADLVVNLPERVIHRLPYLQDIEVALSDLPGHRYPATIREIASEQAADTGTYRTALRQTGLDGEAPLAGLSGTAYLTFADNGAQSDSEILVPSSAVFVGDAGGDFVWVVQGDPATVTARGVTVTGVVDERTRVSTGLNDGERIVAYGVDFLHEGQSVRPFALSPLHVAGGRP